MFEELIKHVNSQKEEADELRKQANAASKAAMEASNSASSQLERVLVEEREQAATDRQALLQQITGLIMAQGETQDARVEAKISKIKTDMKSSAEVFEASKSTYNEHMDLWDEKEQKLVEEVQQSREKLKSRLKEDWAVSITRHIDLCVADIQRPPISIMLLFKQPQNLFTKRLSASWMSK